MVYIIYGDIIIDKYNLQFDPVKTVQDICVIWPPALSFMVTLDWTGVSV